MHPQEDFPPKQEQTMLRRITKLFEALLHLVTDKTHGAIQRTLEQKEETQFKINDEVLFFDIERDAQRGKVLKVESGYVTVQTGPTERRLVIETELKNYTKSPQRKALTETLCELLFLIRTQNKWYSKKKNYVKNELPPAVRNFFKNENYDALFFMLVEIIRKLYPKAKFDEGVTFNPDITSLEELKDVDMECLQETPEIYTEPYSELMERIEAIDASEGDDVLLLIRHALKLMIEIYKEEKLVH